MILAILKSLQRLSGYHYTVLAITTLIPGIGALVASHFWPDCLIVRVTVFLVLALMVMLAAAFMIGKDQTATEQRAVRIGEAHSREIDKLRQEQDAIVESHRREHRDLDEFVNAIASALSKQPGVTLPPRSVSLRLTATAGSPRISVRAEAVGANRWARLRRLIKHAACWIWERVYGKSDD